MCNKLSRELFDLALLTEVTERTYLEHIYCIFNFLYKFFNIVSLKEIICIKLQKKQLKPNGPSSSLLSEFKIKPWINSIWLSVFIEEEINIEILNSTTKIAF